MPLVCCVRFLFCYRRIIGKASRRIGPWKLGEHVRLQPSIFFVGTFCFKEKIFRVVCETFLCLCTQVEHFRKLFVCKSVSMNGKSKHAEIKQHLVNSEVTLAQNGNIYFHSSSSFFVSRQFFMHSACQHVDSKHLKYLSAVLCLVSVFSR